MIEATGLIFRRRQLRLIFSFNPLPCLSVEPPALPVQFPGRQYLAVGSFPGVKNQEEGLYLKSSEQFDAIVKWFCWEPRASERCKVRVRCVRFYFENRILDYWPKFKATNQSSHSW